MWVIVWVQQRPIITEAHGADEQRRWQWARDHPPGSRLLLRAGGAAAAADPGLGACGRAAVGQSAGRQLRGARSRREARYRVLNGLHGFAS